MECRRRSLLMEHLMDKSHGHRSFSDSRRDAFDVAAAYVADGEDSGPIRLQQVRRPRQRPGGCRQILLRQVRTGLDESARVEHDAAIEPAGIGDGTSHDEDVSDAMRLDDACPAIAPLDAIEMPLALQR